MSRRTRVRTLTAVLLVLLGALGVQAVTSDVDGGGVGERRDGVYPGNTLITVQSYDWFHKNNGKAFVVAPNGTVLWEYDPPRTRVFDAEALDNGNFLLTTARFVPSEACPPEFQDTRRDPGHCVQNRIVEVDRETKEVVWNYSWYDVHLIFHETHDADRLPSGETLIADMGNERVFAVNQSGAVTWEWHAEEHIGPGTEFWRTYVPDDERAKYRREGPESDWTHLNDVDAIGNGRVQVSIRNFDVVVTVDRATKDVVNVVGRPGNHSVLQRQHDPHRLGETVLVPDSENDRIVERDVETGAVVWSFTGEQRRLQWPRDADRLPNGNTLVADSRGFRVLEVNETGAVVWSYSLVDERGIVYDADRLGVPEEPTDVPSGRELTGPGEEGAGSRGPVQATADTVASWAGFVLPPWVRGTALLTLSGAVAVAAALVVDLALLVGGRLRS